MIKCQKKRFRISIADQSFYFPFCKNRVDQTFSLIYVFFRPNSTSVCFKPDTVIFFQVFSLIFYFKTKNSAKKYGTGFWRIINFIKWLKNQEIRSEYPKYRMWEKVSLGLLLQENILG
jgi:hypothetical protein